MFLGFLVLIIGVLFLMQNLGYISGGVWEIFWPACLIIAGLFLVFRQKESFGIFRKKK